MEEKYSEDFIINTITSILKHQEKGELALSDNSFHDVFPKGQNISETENFLRSLIKPHILNLEIYAEDGYDAEWSIKILNMKALISYLENAIKTKNDEIKSKDDKIQTLIKEKNDILSYNPETINESICKAQDNIKAIKDAIANTDLLASLLPTINQTEEYIKSVSEINNNYVSIYKNIILPIQKEGESGVKATVKWAIISIILSTIISTIITIITK